MKLKNVFISTLSLFAVATVVRAEEEGALLVDTSENLTPAIVSATASIASRDVRVNSIGYKPKLAKRATVMGDHDKVEWSIRRSADDTVALSGELASAVVTSDSNETVQLVDFSALTVPGTYYLYVDGVGNSVPFRVADDVYNDSFELQLAGLYGLRCGTAVSISHGGETFHHDVCHAADGKMDYVGGTGTKDGTGGWHDAGDYGKYMVNAAFSVGVMLKSWEHFSDQLGHAKLPIPEAGSTYPDFLDEMKYEIDWMLKNAAVYGDGRIPHKLTRTGFSAMVMPSTDKEDRYWVPYGSAATAGFTAVMAQAARIYRPYDAAYADKLQSAADQSYAWLQAHPERHDPDQSGFSTGGYGSSDADDRLWAAAEMWETTGSAEALADFEKRASGARRKIGL
jgi:endoglucanase